ncbi:MAG: ABC transporter ATP-binding protein [Acuticoccus sp.]
MLERAPMNDRATAETDYVRLDGVSKRFVSRMSAVEAGLARLGMNYHDTVVHAVSDVTLSVPRATVLGLVGESGCGKSTLGRIAAGLLAPSAGAVHMAGARIDRHGTTCDTRTLLKAQMVFQNPMASLNPRQKVSDIITEGPLAHGLIRGRERCDFAAERLAEVGLSVDAMDRLPHQFSGGQRQRIGIARALSVSPDFLVCDEPVAALDVSIQAQIINLLIALQESRGLTILFISHDLGVVKHLCDRIAVMYLGKIVEEADAAELFAEPAHPYTQALLNEMPSVKSGRRAYQPVEGEIPSPLNPPSGCHFHPRCPSVSARCRAEVPPLFARPGNATSRCWLCEGQGAGAAG